MAEYAVECINASGALSTLVDKSLEDAVDVSFVFLYIATYLFTSTWQLFCMLQIEKQSIKVGCGGRSLWSAQYACVKFSLVCDNAGTGNLGVLMSAQPAPGECQHKYKEVRIVDKRCSYTSCTDE